MESLNLIFHMCMCNCTYVYKYIYGIYILRTQTAKSKLDGAIDNIDRTSAAEAIEQLMQAKAESIALDLALNARVRVIRCAGRYI